jgi:hypothetical protein
VSRATATGHTEQAGDLIFNCTGGGGATTLASITVAYGVTITNSVGHPTTRPVAISGATGSFTGGGLPTIASVSNATGQVVISVPAQGAAALGSFSLTGVLVSLNGTNFNNLQATVSVSPGNNVLITAGQDVATVITSVQQGINTTSAPPALVAGTQPALYFGSTAAAVPTRGTFAFTITENYIDMFRDATVATTQWPGASHDTQLLVTFSGLATASTIGGCTAVLSGAVAGVPGVMVNGNAAGVAATATTAAPTLRLDFDAPVNLTAVETITVTCTSFTIGGSTPLPLTTAITATVTLAPTGSALTGGGGVHTTAGSQQAPGVGAVPRYQSTPISIGTVLTFTPNTTTMIIPFALGNPSLTAPTGTFDTGIVVANTTGETVGGTGIFAAGGAQAQGGTVTFHFFPNSGTAADRFSITTASIASGASFISNVSEMLRGAGRTASFSGYIIAVANFTNAHGMAFVYGGSAADRITSATDVMTISPPVVAARTALAGLTGVEVTSK